MSAFDPWIPIGMIAVGSIGIWVSAWLFTALHDPNIMYQISDMNQSIDISMKAFNLLRIGTVAMLAASTLYFYGGYTEYPVFIRIGEILYLTVGFIGIFTLRILEVELL